MGHRTAPLHHSPHSTLVPSPEPYSPLGSQRGGQQRGGNGSGEVASNG